MGDYDPIDENASMTKKGWLTAILELGAWVGTLLSGFLAEVLSRKYGIIVACCVFLLGVVVQAVSITASNTSEKFSIVWILTNNSAQSRLVPVLSSVADS